MLIMELFLLSLFPTDTCAEVRSEEVKSSVKHTIAQQCTQSYSSCHMWVCSVA